MQDSFTYSIHKLVWLMDAVANDLLKDNFNITFPKFYVLAVLSTCQPTTQANLAFFLKQSPAAVSNSVAILEREGLVSITKNINHKRQNIVSLTEAGAQLNAAASKFLEEHFFDGIKNLNVNIDEYIKQTVALHDGLAESSNCKK